MARTREFIITEAKRERCPLLLGLVGPSGSGKTYSALRLATGIQKVYGGDIVYIDTEARRALHYADQFKFKHIDFRPPFGPLDYKAAIQAALEMGARVIIVDSMTHEHSGEGGVLAQADKFLDDKCGNDFAKRERMKMLSFAAPKAQRKDLNNFIVQSGAQAAMIFCYRAHQKMSMKKGETPRDIGYQHETTSPLMYEMIQQFLLRPCSNGIPELRPSIPEELQIVKSPAQFADWFHGGAALSEDIGERFARWAIGDDAAMPAIPQPVSLATELVDVVDDILAAESMDALKALYEAAKKAYPKSEHVTIADAKDKRKAQLEGVTA
jgi:hypothetical protein